MPIYCALVLPLAATPALGQHVSQNLSGYSQFAIQPADVARLEDDAHAQCEARADRMSYRLPAYMRCKAELIDRLDARFSAAMRMTQSRATGKQRAELRALRREWRVMPRQFCTNMLRDKIDYSFRDDANDMITECALNETNRRILWLERGQ